VPIHRLWQQLQWPSERFDAVVEGLRAAHHVELDGAANPAVTSFPPVCT
jgi:hypothetical protein